MMKRGELGEDEEKEALSLSHSRLINSWSHDNNLLLGDSSSSSSMSCLRPPSDYSLSSLRDGSSVFISPPCDLSLCESHLHRLNIREEQDKNHHHPEISCNMSSIKPVHQQGTFSNHSVPSNSPQSLGDFKGYIYLMAKDQHGCRSLQRILEEGTYLDTMVIFRELIPHVAELMTSSFGLFLMQKLLDVCNEEQRGSIILAVTSEPGLLVSISLNAHGTRVVQRLVESIKTKEHILLVTSALRPGFLNLALDVNGNHVIERCLRYLTPQDNEMLLGSASISQRINMDAVCYKNALNIPVSGQQREKRLITEICRNSLLLAKDPYGNYLVQFIIKMMGFQATAMVLARLEGHYEELSTQKFSRHVVQLCLTHCPESRPQIVHELISVPRFDLLVQDRYAKFVIQAALSATKGPLHDKLLKSLRHLNLRKSTYCKGIFSSNLKKN